VHCICTYISCERLEDGAGSDVDVDFDCSASPSRLRFGNRSLRAFSIWRFQCEDQLKFFVRSSFSLGVLVSTDFRRLELRIFFPVLNQTIPLSSVHKLTNKRSFNRYVLRPLSFMQYLILFVAKNKEKKTKKHP